MTSSLQNDLLAIPRDPFIQPNKKLLMGVYPVSNEMGWKEVLRNLPSLPPFGNLLIGVSCLINFEIYLQRHEITHVIILDPNEPLGFCLQKIKEIVLSTDDQNQAIDTMVGFFKKESRQLFGQDVEDIEREDKINLALEKAGDARPYGRWLRVLEYFSAPDCPWKNRENFLRIKALFVENRFFHLFINLHSPKLFLLKEVLERHNLFLDTFYVSNVLCWLFEDRFTVAKEWEVLAKNDRPFVFLQATQWGCTGKPPHIHLTISSEVVCKNRLARYVRRTRICDNPEHIHEAFTRLTFAFIETVDALIGIYKQRKSVSIEPVNSRGIEEMMQRVSECVPNVCLLGFYYTLHAFVQLPFETLDLKQNTYYFAQAHMDALCKIVEITNDPSEPMESRLQQLVLAIPRYMKKVEDLFFCHGLVKRAPKRVDNKESLLYLIYVFGAILALKALTSVYKKIV